MIEFADLVAAGVGAGLDVVSACPAAPFEDVRHILEERRAVGHNGSMQFTYRNPARSTDPRATLAEARTLVVAARSYHREVPARPQGRGPVARVARYVWADDHEQLLGGLEAIAEILRAAGYRALVLADQNNLVDRAVAERAGLGWYGKNANLLIPGQGSWFVLGSVLTDAGPDDIAGLPDGPPVADGCGTCERCLPACPTGAIVAPGVIDARRCLSWTLQAEGVFPVDQRVALGDRIYGCDECQDVCPPNRVELRRADRPGSARPNGLTEQAWVPLLELLASSDDEVMTRRGRWYIAKRDPRYLRRNALVVLGNVGDGNDPEVRQVLETALADPDPLLRAHAVWAARRLGCDDLLVALRSDTDPDVRAEIEREVTPR